MVFPEVDLKPGDTIFKADEKVEHAFEGAGLSLVAFDGLNSFLEIASHCHFFQVPNLPARAGETSSGVIAVLAKPWDENTLIQVLNILLEMRMDPDPPGSRVLFHFYSPYELPKVLRSMFGSAPCCHFETRSLLVARFGHDLKPELCQQLAAVGAHLSRGCFHEAVSMTDPRGEEIVERLVRDHLLAGEECVEPTNSLLALGCLNGELLRGRLPFSSAWAEVEDCDPWPGLVFGDAQSEESRVVYDPIGETLAFFESPDTGRLVRANRQLLARCHEVLGEQSSGSPEGLAAPK